MDIIFNTCPVLPLISDPILKERVFTHRSFVVRPTNTFEDNPSDTVYDNESLEHLGDSVVNLCATNLIQSLILSYMQGQHHLNPIHANLFEAYVGALFREQGLTPVNEFISQLLTPSVRLAYEMVRSNYVEGVVPSVEATLVFPSTNVPGVANLPPAPLIAHPLPYTAESGCTSLLNQHFAQQHKSLDWEFSPPTGTSSAPVWEVRAIERPGKLLATATAGNKKTAKNIAARKALIQLGILQDSPIPHTGTEIA
ncbi:hypothetical protein B0J17DRAFT_625636 [Rhizoctonia solani]|nr:hypothetical protein B0J17DRAFT_625636 [Rhizoctonia solani]